MASEIIVDPVQPAPLPPLGPVPPGPVRYKMLGLDVNSAPSDRNFVSVPTQYRTWIVEGEPDFTGQYYTGEKSGPDPFVNVSAYAIFDPNIVVNFNLPNPLDWASTYSTLPANIYDSQIAIINGYIYLFGGINSSVIWAASLNTPTQWFNTGASLPVPLAGSQLAIIGDTIYMFGGQTSASLTSATDIVLSAPVSNPLSWTNNGSVLPRKLSHSQLCITGSNIYLFGGYEINNASDVIFTAPLSNPLAWTDTGHQLRDPLYASQIAINNGYAYLLGGLLTPQTGTATIYACALTDPLTWYEYGNLPYPCYYGQYCTIGQQGYLFTQADTTTSFTKILSCNLDQFATSWTDTHHHVPGTISQSQLAIIYDRIWLFGGNGSTIIFANNSVLKYALGDMAVLNYGNITRTQYQAAEPNPLNLFEVIGFPYWKTDYGALFSS